MTRGTVAPHRETEQDDEAIRTVTSSSPSRETFDHKLQKEIISPVTVTPVPSGDTIINAGMHDARTGKQKRTEVLQLMALFWSGLYVGCNDGSIGPLLPRIQQVYHVGYTVVSLIFICYCIGFILGSLANFYLTHRLGFGKTIILGSVCQVIACGLQASGPPFPVFVIAQAINGFGVSLQVSQGMGLIVSIKRNSDIKMGVYQAVYGLGALLVPFASTQFAQMRYWNFYYLIALGMAVLNLISLSIVFGFKTMGDCLKLIGDEVREKNPSEHSTFGQVLRIRAVHWLALFCFFYIGAQHSIGGWIVTFFLEVRGGGSSSGYVTSGFFAGLMLGRIVLLWVNRKLGARLAIFSYVVLAIALELVIWLVPSLIGGMVTVCFVGLLLGPMFPVAIIYIGYVIPAPLVPSSVTWIAGFSMTGRAVFPFLTGAIASKHGIETIHPLAIAMLGCMLFFWYLVPAKQQN